MPPQNDTSNDNPNASLESSTQIPDETTEEIASAANSLDQETSNLDPGASQGDSSGRNIFSTVEELDSKKEDKKTNRIFSLIRRFDRYLLIFLFIILLVILVIFYIIQKKSSTTATVKSTSLSQSTLTQLNSNSVVVGGNQETLDIQSNSVFEGSALIKGGLQVAGTLVIAGNTTLNNVTVSGNAELNQIAGNSLTINNGSTLKGQLVVGQSLTVSGTSTLNGAVDAGKLTVSSLQVNGNINIDYHLVTNGVSPTIKSLGIIGSGGTVSINGSDTSGTVAINFGSSASAGCDVTISYNQPFPKIPSVIISPSNSGAANINYYVTNKSDTGFTICSSGASDTTANFDYFVID